MATNKTRQVQRRKALIGSLTCFMTTAICIASILAVPAKAETQTVYKVGDTIAAPASSFFTLTDGATAEIAKKTYSNNIETEGVVIESDTNYTGSFNKVFTTSSAFECRFPGAQLTNGSVCKFTIESVATGEFFDICYGYPAAGSWGQAYVEYTDANNKPQRRVVTTNSFPIKTVNSTSAGSNGCMPVTPMGDDTAKQTTNNMFAVQLNGDVVEVYIRYGNKIAKYYDLTASGTNSATKQADYYTSLVCAFDGTDTETADANRWSSSTLTEDNDKYYLPKLDFSEGYTVSWTSNSANGIDITWLNYAEGVYSSKEEYEANRNAFKDMVAEATVTDVSVYNGNEKLEAGATIALKQNETVWDVNAKVTTQFKEEQFVSGSGVATYPIDIIDTSSAGEFNGTGYLDGMKIKVCAPIETQSVYNGTTKLNPGDTLAIPVGATSWDLYVKKTISYDDSSLEGSEVNTPISLVDTSMVATVDCDANGVFGNNPLKIKIVDPVKAEVMFNNVKGAEVKTKYTKEKADGTANYTGTAIEADGPYSGEFAGVFYGDFELDFRFMGETNDADARPYGDALGHFTLTFTDATDDSKYFVVRYANSNAVNNPQTAPATVGYYSSIYEGQWRWITWHMSSKAYQAQNTVGYWNPLLGNFAPYFNSDANETGAVNSLKVLNTLDGTMDIQTTLNKSYTDTQGTLYSIAKFDDADKESFQKLNFPNGYKVSFESTYETGTDICFISLNGSSLYDTVNFSGDGETTISALYETEEGKVVIPVGCDHGFSAKQTLLIAGVQQVVLDRGVSFSQEIDTTMPMEEKEITVSYGGTEKTYLVSIEDVFSDLKVNMVEGASVRLSLEDTGLRFSSRIEKSKVDALTEKGYTVTLGILIAPQDIVEKNGALTLENDKYVLNESLMNIVGFKTSIVTVAGVEYIQVQGVISNIIEQNYTRQFTAVGYMLIEKSGETVKTVYAENEQTRSVYYVASKAHEDRANTNLGELGTGILEDFIKIVDSNYEFTVVENVVTVELKETSEFTAYLPTIYYDMVAGKIYDVTIE